MISVIIPVYKNKTEFLKNLEHNMKFLVDCEIIVVNDDPSKSLSQDFKSIPKVVLIENEQNMGFGQTVNIGVNHSHNDYIMLLNSDVILNDVNFLHTLIQFKTNPSLFGISFAQRERNNAVIGKNRIYWADGFFSHSKSPDLIYGKNGWAEGGTCMLDKSKFLTIGGFDTLYSPFYWEDVDLSYRAWKSGYEIIFDPATEMIHHHESTIGKYFSKNFIQTIALRNQLIFIWKNITDKSLLAQHSTTVLKMMARATIKGEFFKIQAILQAMARLPTINKKRKLQSALYKKTDIEIINIFQRP